MGCSLSAISDDIDDYDFYCRHFGVEPHTTRTSQGYSVEDCYGAHADLLKRCYRDKIPLKKALAELSARHKVLAALKPSGKWYIDDDHDEHDNRVHYAIDVKRKDEWQEWKRIAKIQQIKALPPFVRLIDIDTFTFTDKTL